MMANAPCGETMARRDSCGIPCRLLVTAVLMLTMGGGVVLADGTHKGFKNVAAEVGFTHTQKEFDGDFGYAYLTGGAAVGDFFGDGLNHVFFTRHGERDIFYRNMGDGTFKDVTEEVFGPDLPKTKSNGAMFADLTNNGHLDLYVTTADSDRHFLYINDGNGRLIEQAAERGVDRYEHTGELNAGMSVTAADYTGNGYLDLYVADWRWRGDFTPMSRNRLYRNLGPEKPGYFEDVTDSAGLDNPGNQNGFTGRFVDMNKNGLMDLLAVNDHRYSQYYLNNGDGTFTEASRKMGTGTGRAEMGSTVADYNNNGWLDWFVTSISTAEGNRLYRNEMHRGIPGVHFSDQTTSAGVRDGGWGWATSFIDYDNNGLRDLVMVNGYFLPKHEDTPMLFWRNNGREALYSFTEIGERLGLTDAGQGRGLLVADFFNDGTLDILVINHGAEPLLYRNLGGTNNKYLRIKTVGSVSNRMGIGAFITVTKDLTNATRTTQVHDINLGSNFLAHNETTAHFGLGQLEGTVDRVHIRWPSGLEQELFDVEPNQVLTLYESDARDPNAVTEGDATAEAGPEGAVE